MLANSAARRGRTPQTVERGWMDGTQGHSLARSLARSLAVYSVPYCVRSVRARNASRRTALAGPTDRAVVGSLELPTRVAHSLSLKSES